MSAIEPVRLTWPGRSERQVPPGDYRLAETFEPLSDGVESSAGPDWAGRLYHDDNRPVLAHLAAEHAAKIRLAYLDPPYLSGVPYAREVLLRESGRSAGRVVEYDDRLDEGEYLQRLYECLRLCRDLLAPDGSIWLHCDYRQSHHLRCLLDEVFGADAFRNEVVWAYGSTARGAKAIGRQLPRNHDVLLWYAGPAARYRPLAIDARIPASEAARAGYQVDASGRPFRTAPRGDYTDASLARLAEEGRVHRTRSGRLRVKYFARREGDEVVEERLLGDVWTDVPDAMHLPADEPTGYPTQKPERLLERVILASTDPGDLVLDPFAGSGTTLAVAQRLGRRWIGVDASRGAIQACRRRLVGGEPDPLAPFPAGTDLTPVPFPAREGEPGGGLPRPDSPSLPEVERLTSPLPFREGGQGVRFAGKGDSGLGPSSFRIYETLGSPEREAGGTTVRLHVEPVGDGTRLRVEVVGYDSPALAARLGDGVDWREALDCVLIDPTYDGRVFRARLADAPRGRRAPIAGRYEVPLPPPGSRVAVKLVDVLGDETFVLLA